jgi:hypothetical protein
MSEAHQMLLELQWHGDHRKIVRAYTAGDLADWCTHGSDLSKPFAEAGKRAKKWVITHIRTTRRMPEGLIPFMTFATAIDVCAYLDEHCVGASQVEHRGDKFEVVGWDRTMQSQVISALLSYHQSKKPILTNYAETEFRKQMHAVSQ